MGFSSISLPPYPHLYSTVRIPQIASCLLSVLTFSSLCVCSHSMTGDKCKNCSLWSDVMEDDERAAKEIQKKANEDASIKGK